MKTGDTFKNLDAISLQHSAFQGKSLLHTIDVRTKIFNERMGLPNNKAIAFQIRKGFNTDGASIPEFLWWFISPLAWWILFPAIVHDWAWRERYINAFIVDTETGLIESKHGILPLSYNDGTRMMLEKMESFYGGFLQRYIVYYTLEAVRVLLKREK